MKDKNDIIHNFISLRVLDENQGRLLWSGKRFLKQPFSFLFWWVKK